MNSPSRDRAPTTCRGDDSSLRSDATDGFRATLRYAVARYGRTLTTREVLDGLAACIREVEEDA
jgi:hypothetical protein